MPGMPATVNSNIVDPINVNIPLFTSSVLLCWVMTFAGLFEFRL